MSSYITSTGLFLPNDPIENDSIEKYLGQNNKLQAKIKNRILNLNGIKNRHYALNTDGIITHHNSQLAAQSILDAVKGLDINLSEFELLTAGTSLPDLMLPSHASQVHGELGEHGVGNIEIHSCSGVCHSSFSALTLAHSMISSGLKNNALVTGSERVSPYLCSRRFTEEQKHTQNLHQLSNYKYLSGEFLRWMLSDGGASLVLENTPRNGRTNLEIVSLSSRSFANELPMCMYLGANTNEVNPSGTWLGEENISDAEMNGKLVIRQDTDLLNKNMISLIANEAKRLSDDGFYNPEKIKYFLPHISSMIFYTPLQDALKERGIHIPSENYYTNLSKVGNIGSAAFFALIHGLLDDKTLENDDEILVMIPESGRFTVAYALLRCKI